MPVGGSGRLGKDACGDMRARSVHAKLATIELTSR